MVVKFYLHVLTRDPLTKAPGCSPSILHTSTEVVLLLSQPVPTEVSESAVSDPKLQQVFKAAEVGLAAQQWLRRKARRWEEWRQVGCVARGLSHGTCNIL